MRNLVMILGASIVALGGCKWTDFDDLREEAWVNATAKPDNGSTNWGVAINRGSIASPDGGKLAVIGTAESIYNEIEYRNNGTAKLAGNQQELNDQFGIGNLEAQPILLANPTSDEVALVTKSGAQQVVVLKGVSGDLTPHQVFGADTADAAAYVVAPGIDGGATPQIAQPIIASVDKVFGTFFTPPEQPFNQPKCQLVDGVAPIAVRALGAVRLPAATTDDVVVWSASGKLYVINGQVFNGARSAGVCPDPNVGDTDITGVLAPTAIIGTPLDLEFIPEIGSQILVFGGQFALLQGHTAANGGLLAVVNLMTMQKLPMVVTLNGLRAAALHEVGGVTHVVAGYPTDVIDGVSSGKVLVFPVSTTNGVDATPIETLHDAQPDDGQAFGRAVAVIPYNNQPIIAVAGNNEVFVYYRTASLYPDDTRQGR